MGVRVWLIKLLGGKIKEKAENGHDFGDDDRALGLRLRQLNARHKELEQQIKIKAAEERLCEVEERLSEFYENEEEEDYPQENPFERVLADLISTGLKNNQGQKQEATINDFTKKETLSDDQLREIMKAATPDEIKAIKSYPEDVVFNHLKGRFSTIDDDSIRRGIRIVKQM